MLALPKNIRVALGHYHFLRETKKKHAERSTVSFDHATKIGVLYDATDEHEFEVVKNYVKHVRGNFRKDIFALGFVDRKVLPSSQYAQFGLDFFTRKSLDYKMVPKDIVVTNFMDEKYDILINLASSRCFPLRYIAALSNAKFRVGRFDKKDIHCYDMMVEIKGEPPVKTVIEEMETCLRQIRN